MSVYPTKAFSNQKSPKINQIETKRTKMDPNLNRAKKLEESKTHEVKVATLYKLTP